MSGGMSGGAAGTDGGEAGDPPADTSAASNRSIRRVSAAMVAESPSLACPVADPDAGPVGAAPAVRRTPSAAQQWRHL